MYVLRPRDVLDFYGVVGCGVDLNYFDLKFYVLSFSSDFCVKNITLGNSTLKYL